MDDPGAPQPVHGSPLAPQRLFRHQIGRATECVFQKKLHAFQKKTQKTRKQDIDAAKQALKQLQQRGIGDE